MNEKKIYEYIRQKVDRAYMQSLAESGAPGGVTAQDIEREFGMYRSNASALLNALVKKNLLIKIESRPVYFLPVDALGEIIGQQAVHTSYTQQEFMELLSPAPTNKQDVSDDAFAVIIGSDASLADQVEQAKAAMLYPPHGLHTLLIGESGTGKNMFSRAMYNYAVSALGKKEAEYPYITFNCADYYNNPQLLMSHLFGYVKGAFTGADKETSGVVEKADGGVLFLDEIHRLPPEGQELLFYLIDAGQYRKLGESAGMRKAQVLIIGATTEDPEKTLLKTFLRRIPLTIALPPFREKPLEEKIKVIESYFMKESTAIQRTFIIRPPVFQALAAYEYAGNLGQLSSEIKVLCARTFLEGSSTAEGRLVVRHEQLSPAIREYYRKAYGTLPAFPHNYDFDVIIKPSSNIQYLANNTFDEDSYQSLIDKINHYTLQGYSKSEMAQALSAEIRTYYHGILDNFQHRQINKQEMYKAVEPDIVDFTVDVMQKEALASLGTAATQKNILVMAFHIQFLIERLKRGQNEPDKEVHRDEIRKEYAKELEVAQQIVEKIRHRFEVTVPSSEKYLIAVLLANSAAEPAAARPRLYIMAHGNSTASSMAEVCNRLMECQYVKGIDAPLEQSVEDTYQHLLAELRKNPQESGVILLADMGSLLHLGERATKETGMKIYTIPNVTTLMALDITRMFCRESAADKVYAEFTSKIQPGFQFARRKKPAVMTLCASGVGTSRAFQAIIQEELKKIGLNIFVAALNYNDVRECSQHYQELCREYEFVACVGNIDAGADVPFFHISELLSQEDKLRFVKFISGIAERGMAMGEPEAQSLEEECRVLLRKNVVFVNPDVAVKTGVQFLKAADLPQLRDNDPLHLSLLLHIGFMIERNILQTKIVFDREEAFIAANSELYRQFRSNMHILEAAFEIEISDAEICYLIQSVSSEKKQKK